MSSSALPHDDHDPTGGFTRRLLAFARNVDARIVQNPKLALAAALGVGFAAGGGLSMRIGRMLFMSAARQAVRSLF